MPSKQQKAKKPAGFTIIEVVLVLAIAGLIFLMVFVALPALQRSQRDTQRRNDISQVATALTNYQTNHQNNLPEEGSVDNDVEDFSNDKASEFLKNYLNASGADTNGFKDPDGTIYGMKIFASGSNGGATLNTVNDRLLDDSMDHMIYVATEAKCGREGIEQDAGKKNKYAVAYRLEGAGFYCVDNK